MYIVKFIRVDKKPTEEYYYNTIEEARWHLSMFAEDDTGLYERIEIVEFDKPQLPIEFIMF